MTYHWSLKNNFEDKCSFRKLKLKTRGWGTRGPVLFHARERLEFGVDGSRDGQPKGWMDGWMGR